MLLLKTSAKEVRVADDDWPRCAMCEMPVEDFRVTDTGDSIILMAACHGKTELATIPDTLWDTANTYDVDFDQAFANGGNNHA